VRAKVIETALAHTALSPRELACRITDREGEFLSESSVYRILKAADLIESPAYILLQAAARFQHPTCRRNELWQTDFTYLPVVDWGWYFLSTVLDDYSRKILAWKLSATMRVEVVTQTLDLARAATGVDRVRIRHKPRLLSDNGPCSLAKDLADYLAQHQIDHTRGRPYHPMTQVKIERYHRSVKNVLRLENHYSPGDLERAVARFGAYYNHERLHEAIGNVTPDEMYHGRQREILTRREKIKRLTLERRKKENLRNAA
jgi:transposase InsO family protein